MNYNQIKSLVLLFFSIISINAIGQNIAEIDSLFQSIYNQEKFNGNVLISKNKNIIFNKSYGYSNIETQEPLSDRSIFNLASLTKQFTAAGIILLKRDGKLNYDDDIRKYLPELDFYPKITIQELIHHTSGIPNFYPLSDSLILKQNKDILLNNQSIIGMFKENKPKLNFTPNTKYEYSNTGYLFLAIIIERVSKQPFEKYLEKTIFTPLKMNNTKFLTPYRTPTNVPNLTIGFQDNVPGELIKASEVTPEVFNYDYVKGSGGLYSTTLDLNIWSNALDGRFFTKSELTKITQETTISDEKIINYGFGWEIKRDILRGKSLYHSGGAPGYTTYIQKDLEQNVTIIILQNINAPNVTIPTFPLTKLIYRTPKLKLDQNYLKSLAGNYKTPSGKIKNIIFENGKLYIPMNPSVKLELIPRSKTIFKVNGFEPEVNFEFNVENGEVKGYNFYQLNLGKNYTTVKMK